MVPDRRRLGLVGQQRQRARRCGRSPVRSAARDDPVAALHLVACDARKIERTALTDRCRGRFRGSARGCSRTRTSRPAGATTMLSPTRTSPECTVPVTTVPMPASVNERSTANRKCPSSERLRCSMCALPEKAPQRVDSRARAARYREDLGASASGVGASNWRTSSLDGVDARALDRVDLGDRDGARHRRRAARECRDARASAASRRRRPRRRAARSRFRSRRPASCARSARGPGTSTNPSTSPLDSGAYA